MVGVFWGLRCKPRLAWLLPQIRTSKLALLLCVRCLQQFLPFSLLGVAVADLLAASQPGSVSRKTCLLTSADESVE